MIIKFFPHPKTGGNPRRSMEYLLKKKEDEVQVLQGNPRLSVDIAESLSFKNQYTVGCLSFEEPNIPENHKQEIIQKFEKTFFPGLKPEQYNICWIEHTDKHRLELNFFIPNVELETGNRLSVYYDKVDRPLADNFKQVINSQYVLSDPNAPQKRQMVVSSRNIPKNKKDAQQVINEFLEGELKRGLLQTRQDVLNRLTEAGFEIARITPKNISIKTDGQNLRLKGAIYEQSFELNRAIEEIQRAKGLGGETSLTNSDRRACEELERAVRQRYAEFSKRFGTPRKNHTQRLNQTLQNTLLVRDGCGNDLDSNNILSRQRSEDTIRSNESMETVSRALQDAQQASVTSYMHNTRQGAESLCENQSNLQRPCLWRKSRLPDYQLREHKNDTDRKAFEERIRQFSETAERAYERIKRTLEQVRAGKPTVEELA